MDNRLVLKPDPIHHITTISSISAAEIIPECDRLKGNIYKYQIIDQIIAIDDSKGKGRKGKERKGKERIR